VRNAFSWDKNSTPNAAKARPCRLIIHPSHQPQPSHWVVAFRKAIADLSQFYTSKLRNIVAIVYNSFDTGKHYKCFPEFGSLIWFPYLVNSSRSVDPR
jgi:soluble lytic murein transglycosylase-like protein